MNNDGVVDACEVHTCVVAMENTWRLENCDSFNTLYCDCPFTSLDCAGQWNCETIYDVTTYYLSSLDENYDGVISSEDDIDYEHL
jgi:hypothetical protein